MTYIKEHWTIIASIIVGFILIAVLAAIGKRGDDYDTGNSYTNDTVYFVDNSDPYPAHP